MAGKNSQVVVRIREMILRGQITPDRRVNEGELANKLDVSRADVRESLSILAREGITTRLNAQVFAVRSVSSQETMDAIEVRGALEALASRMLAEGGPSRSVLQSLHACLHEGDAIFAKGRLVSSDAAKYDAMNEEFHSLVVQGAGSKVVADAIRRNGRIPFAAAHTVAFGQRDLVRAYDSLSYLHRQHHEIVCALENREGLRVAALMLEHAYEAKLRLSMNRSIWRASFEDARFSPAAS